MLAVLEFIFSSFWTFAGMLLLLVIVLEGLADIFRALRR